jgi:hypothetical protein
MDHIEIALLDYRAHFRRLTWREEVHLPTDSADNQQTAALALALVDVSGKVLSPAESTLIILALPFPIRRRVWILYKAGQADNKRFTTKGLYTAPSASVHAKRV